MFTTIWRVGCSLVTALALAACATTGGAEGRLAGADVLVFSKTAGFRHDSIPAGQEAMRSIARENGFRVEFTEDATVFTPDRLAQYDAVVFLNTTGDVLDTVQQAAFERYIQSGRGLLGVHAATDTESDGKWPWYTRAIGGHFDGHPEIQTGRLEVVNPSDPSVRGLPPSMQVVDEFYNFRDVSPLVNHIVRIDGSSYKGAASPGLNPFIWKQRFDGGRIFYVALGHTNESYDTPLLRQLLTEGLRFAVAVDQ